MKKQMICICCPKGCHLSYDDSDGSVSGNSCSRGALYAADEATAPKRVVTTTVRLKSKSLGMLSVKTEAAIPKNLMLSAVRLLDGITVSSPVKTGDIVYKNVLGTGINFVATKTVDE